MTDSPLAGRRVLLVEDEMIVCMMLEDMLAALGCEVVGPAARVDEALALVAAEPVDAVLLDVNLNGQPSYSVAEALTARGVPFVFSTGYDRLLNGYNDAPRLQKPFEQRQLAAVLTGLLAGRAAR